LRAWDINLLNLAPQEYASLMTLVANSANGCEPIDLTLRGLSLDGSASETVQVRIMNEAISVKASSPTLFNVSIELEEFPHAP